MRQNTQIAIIGAGPSGLLLGQLLHKAGIDSVILERQTPEHVLSRIRAGVIEEETARLLDEAGCGKRLREQALVHEGIAIVYGRDHVRIDLKKLTGKNVLFYGQTEITRDLMEARRNAGLPTVYEARDVTLHDFDSIKPSVTYSKDGVTHTIACDFIAGCDGFHGVCRASVKDAAKTHERGYPIGWMGLLADTPPVAKEAIYATGDDGICVCSMRSPTRSRYYLQCSTDDTVENWPDDRFWGTLRKRLVPDIAATLVTGPSLEKSIAPLRSFVAEPMRFGRLFLAGDAAHILPPTGAKGLNLAAADVRDLAQVLTGYYGKDEAGLERYSETALKRTWKTMQFSWWLTGLLHTLPDQTDFDQRLRRAEFDRLCESEALQAVFAEHYVGLAHAPALVTMTKKYKRG